MEISLATEEHAVEWDAFVEKDIFKKFAWRNVLLKTYGYVPYYLMAKEEDKIVAGYPLMLINSKFTDTKLSSLPFAGYSCGPFGDKKYLPELLNEAKRIAIENNAKFIEVADPEVTKIREEGYTILAEKSKFVLDISYSTETIWKNLSKKIRNVIRKAQKAGVTISDGTLEDIYTIHLKNMKRLGTPPHSKKFFENLQQEFGENMKVLFAKYNNKLIGYIIIFFNKRSTLWYAGDVLPQYRTLNPISLLIWYCIELSKERKNIIFNFGVSHKDSGNFNFKKRWNTEIVPADKLVYLIDKRANVLVKDRSKLAKVWRTYVPNLFAEKIGPAFRKALGV